MSIVLKNVTKQYGKTIALDHVNITFGPHKIYGLLGRNGAGKSTMLECIANRRFPDEGEIFIDDMPACENDRAQGRIYLMSENTYDYENSKVKDIFRWTKVYYPDFDMEKAYALAEKFGLPLQKKIKALSTGYSSIYKIIVALCVNVPYVFLDEPVLGLDANHRELFYRLLLETYSDCETTFVLSTHLIEEVAGIIEDVVIIRNGSIISDTNTEELLGAGYTVSGRVDAVDQFVRGAQVIGEDILGGLKSAYVLGKLPEKIPEGMDVSPLDLQKLFIQMTKTEGEM